MKRIIGIDPGLVNTGWAVIEVAGNQRKFVASGVIKPKSGLELSERLKTIFDELQAVVVKFVPDEAAIEITFVNKNPTSTLLLGHGRAAAIVALAKAGVPVFEYEPNKIKKAIAGAGHADKSQVLRMIKIIVPGAEVSKSDEADAIAIALTHANTSSILVG
ncbi:MAG: crossover junction endodeoxyribonuclease RuvC [Alphaproteobacteria bacterium]|nr:crossover junction endodeoxyribonuclease RuvC [Alphaproteobacteria bacterium]